MTNWGIAAAGATAAILLVKSLLGFNSKFTRMETNVANLGKSMEEIKTSIEKRDQKFEEIKTEITGIRTEITGMKTEITGIKTGIEKRDEKIDKKFEEVDKKFDEVKEDIKDLRMEIAGRKMAENFDEMKTDIRYIKEGFAESEKKVKKSFRQETAGKRAAKRTGHRNRSAFESIGFGSFGKEHMKGRIAATA